MTAARAIGRIAGNTLLGGVLLPAIALAFAILIYMTDKRCGSPGDSGGCEMGLAMIVLGAIPLGLLVGLIVGIVRIVLARRPAPPAV